MELRATASRPPSHLQFFLTDCRININHFESDYVLVARRFYNHLLHAFLSTNDRSMRSEPCSEYRAAALSKSASRDHHPQSTHPFHAKHFTCTIEAICPLKHKHTETEENRFISACLCRCMHLFCLAVYARCLALSEWKNNIFKGATIWRLEVQDEL